MAYGLPARGQQNWDDELNNSIEALRADVESSVSKADVAASDAAYARNRADEVHTAVVGGTDAAVSGFINDDTSATKASLSATVAEKVDPLTLLAHTNSLAGPTNSSAVATKVDLITGAATETLVLSSATASADTDHYKVGGRGWKITTAGAATALASVDPPPGGGDPLVVGAAQAVCAWVWVEDATKVTDLQFYLYHDATLTNGNRWGKGTTQSPLHTITTGWNFIRVPVQDGRTSTGSNYALANAWGSIHRATVIAVTNAATSITIGHFYVERHAKAKLVVIADRGYKSFYDSAYPALKSAGIPVTFAIDVMQMGTQVGTIHESMTEAQLVTCSQENGNSMSFHGYTANATATMDATALRADTVGAIDYCRAKGWQGRMWRAAYVQNSAPQHAAVEDLLIASATYDGRTAAVAWPPRDRYNIGRATVDNSTSTTATIDAMFDWLQKTNQTQFVFIHGIDPTYIYSASQALFDYFLSKANAAIAAGWLEATTFEALFFGNGGRVRPANGKAIVEWPQPNGTVVSRNLV